MTAGVRTAIRGRLLPVIAALLAIAIAGCGGGGHKKTSSSTTTTKSKAVKHVKPAAKGQTVMTETVLNKAVSKTLASTTKAKPSQLLLLRTLVPGTSTTAKQTVDLTLDAGPAKTLTVTASSNGQKSQAKITSASGTPITLARVGYGCQLPPTPSFCPAKSASSHSHKIMLKFSAVHQGGVVLSALVGPVNTPSPPVHASDGLVVPAYKPVVTLTARSPTAPASQKPPTPTTAITAHAGDTLTIISRATGTPVGAPQNVTVSIDQGPAKTVTITSMVGGGASSKATVKLDTGGKLALVLPRYVCFAPPTPTFCPPSSVKAASHKYQLTFSSSPYTRPAVISAIVRAS